MFLENWSRRCFLNCVALNSKLRFLPINYDSQAEEFTLVPGWTRWFSYAMRILFALPIFHKIVVCAQLAVCGSWGLDMFVSLDGLLLQIVPVCTALAHILSLEEILSVTNCFPKVLSKLESECGNGMQLSAFNDLGEASRIIFIISGSVVSAPMFPMLSVYFDSVPIFLFPTLSRTGWIKTTEGGQFLSKFVWQLVLYPVEVILYGTPLLLMTFTGSAALVQLGVFKVYMNHLRYNSVLRLTLVSHVVEPI